MKQFVYLDTDIVTSIIAQEEKGVIIQQTKEEATSQEKGKQNSGQVEGHTVGRGTLFGFLQAEGSVGGTRTWDNKEAENASQKAIVEKTLHDAAFDIANEYIHPEIIETSNKKRFIEGSYLELKRVFSYVDLDYLEGLFDESGFIEYLKNTQADEIEKVLTANQQRLNREQRRKNESSLKSEIDHAVKENNKQYDDVAKILKAFRSLVPYNKMLITEDGYLIPLDESYFRIDAKNLGFKYGGEMTCVGMITNTIRKSENSDENEIANPFSSLQNTANETLLALLPSDNCELYVIHPIAIYYGQ